MSSRSPEDDLAEVIDHKVEILRRRHYGDLYIATMYKSYRERYRQAVLFDAETAENYIYYKVFEKLARERELI